MRSPRKRALAASGAALLLLATAGPAAADPISSGTASAYGAHLTLAGTPVVDKAGLESATVDEPDPDVAPLVLVPAAPLAVSGTADGEAAVDVAGGLETTLVNVAQSVEGPYNARGVGTVENLEVLLGVPEEGQTLVTATAVRGEAVAVCSGGTVEYSASSEIIDLVIGGTPVPLNDPITTIIDGLNEALAPLEQVVDIGRNEVSEDGRSVTALRVTVLSAAGEEPLAEVLLGHAEVGEATCGDAVEPPECSDTVDNDGDGVADTDDPDCHTDGDATNPDSYDPDDDSESGDDAPECSDGTDNDGDGVADTDDPDCHTDGNASNPDSYDPNDDSEAADQQALPFAQPAAAAGDTLPNTGAGIATGLAAVLSLASLGLLALRRRLA